VKAFKAVSEEFPAKRLLLLLIGDFETEHDPLSDDILKFLTNDPRVILAGFQTDVRPWIATADVFVFPSYREGFPNVVMQASLLQVPCIVSDINGCNEIISNGITGIVVPAKSVDALSDAMRTMVTDQSLRERYAVAARAFVAENFRREYIWHELRKEYERMLNWFHAKAQSRKGRTRYFM
jgi:glycosyltransferase involved in cell wall biosynthesis